MPRARLTPDGRRFAALLDLENLVIVQGRRLTAPQIQTLLAAMAPQVQGMPVRVATGERALRSGMAAINPNWGVTMVGAEPDAADHALIDAGHQFISCGTTDLVVASGDHEFVPLAAYARLHVVSHADHLSKALHLAATTLTLLPAGAAYMRCEVAS